jgi:hypothetical protein
VLDVVVVGVVVVGVVVVGVVGTTVRIGQRLSARCDTPGNTS